MINIETGFFQMEDVVQITKLKNLDSGQGYALQKISEFVVQHPRTKPENISKAIKMVNSARTPRGLALDVSNFILAHSSENLKVIR